MSILVQDLRYAVRLMLKQPGATAIIVISLALGIGANTMIFTLVNASLLRPLPYPESDRMMMVWFAPPANANLPPNIPATRQNCVALRELVTTLDIACFQDFTFNLGNEDVNGPAPERLDGQQYMGDPTRVAGISPLLGRWWTDEEALRIDDRVLLISYNQWQTRFHSSPDVLGARMRIDDTPATIIGVMPEGYDILAPGEGTDMWLPLPNPPAVAASPVRFLRIPARLKNGVTLAQAQVEMNALATELARRFPRTNQGWTLKVQPFEETARAGIAAPLLTFQGAVGFVLLIACANVAGLLLAQGMGRRKEFGVRAALGSGRRRLVRQLLTESLALALIGGAIGVGLGWAALGLYRNVLPAAGSTKLSIDLSVLGFALLASVVTGLGFGILPALQVARADLTGSLKENSRSATSTRSRQALRSVFLVMQVSLALVLLIGAGLMINSFLRLARVDRGFDPQKLMTFQIQFGNEFFNISRQTMPNGALLVDVNPRVNLVSERIREQLAAIPGVQSATATTYPPLLGSTFQLPFSVEGRQPDTGNGAQPTTEWYPVMAGYFQTLAVPVIRGREFTSQDLNGGLPVALINRTAAERYWPNEDPIGQRVQTPMYLEPLREIVGIVGDIRHGNRDEEQGPQMYVPFTQMPALQAGRGYRTLTFVVRSDLDSAQLTSSLRAAVHEIDPRQAVDAMQPVEQYAADQLARERTYVTLLGSFSLIALVLAVVGIYGVMAHSVRQRTAEIGVRVALGAGSTNILGLIIRRGLVLTAIGLVIGTATALALTRVLQTVLWHVTPSDPMTFALSLITLAGVALLACYIPARRALRVDPVDALRNE